jgi:hypothetical protein
MALVSGTVTKYDVNGQREALSEMISRITPEAVPFMSSAGTGSPCTATLEEWQTDSLADVDGDNARLEGDVASFTTPSTTVRVGNYTQISDKTCIVSETAEVVNKAGRRSQMAMEMAKRAAELKRDQETIFLRAQGGDAGSKTTARRLAALLSWVKTNVDKGTGGGNPAWTSGVPSTARTDSNSTNQRAFTETILKSIIQQGWTSGAEPRTLMVGPVNKQRVSTFTGIATRNLNQNTAGVTGIVGAADVYASDFGTIRVIPNRFQRERDAWLIDWDFVAVRYLRGYRTKNLAEDGDAIKKQLICEYTLQVNNEAALALAADLTTT